jgi:hypothetical protein
MVKKSAQKTSVGSCSASWLSTRPPVAAGVGVASAG